MLTFDKMSRVNRARKDSWHGTDTTPWTGADWSNAMCGEAGEAANIVKKLRRKETGLSSPHDPTHGALMHDLGHEIADVILYLDLLADHYGINLEHVIREKFNIVSEQRGFAERL